MECVEEDEVEAVEPNMAIFSYLVHDMGLVVFDHNFVAKTAITRDFYHPNPQIIFKHALKTFGNDARILITQCKISYVVLGADQIQRLMDSVFIRLRIWMMGVLSRDKNG